MRWKTSHTLRTDLQQHRREGSPDPDLLFRRDRPEEQEENDEIRDEKAIGDRDKATALKPRNDDREECIARLVT